jgi:hypothetical protein
VDGNAIDGITIGQKITAWNALEIFQGHFFASAAFAYIFLNGFNNGGFFHNATRLKENPVFQERLLMRIFAF